MRFHGYGRAGLVAVAVMLLFAARSLEAQVNLAPFGTAAQSSEWNNGQFPASLGIDGDFANFTHTSADVGPAIWEVDLGADTAIERIVLHNRTNCCPSRLRDIVVSIHGISFTADDLLDEVLVADPIEPGDILPLWDSALWESDMLNNENVLGGGVDTAGPGTLEIDLLALEGVAVTGRFVRVTRISDLDLSGTAGGGNNAEARVLSLGEVEVFAQADNLPPLIQTQPVGGQVDVGASFTFSVDAIGSDPLAYQWLKDGGEIDGATESSLVIDPVALTDAGLYSVIVSNALGDVASDEAALRVNEFPNIAPLGTATQSTTGFGGAASRGNDGNTDGIYNNASVTHTATGDLAPWWEVLLDGPAMIHSLSIWNRTDACCPQRLSNFRVLILDADRDELFSGDYFTDGTFPDTIANGFDIDIDPPIEGARIVRVELIEDPLRLETFLSLAEVQAFGEIDIVNPNLARLRPTAQSSDLNATNVSGLAVDGNPNTFTHTLAGQAPAIWEVELADATPLELIVLRNRTNCCGSRLRDIIVSIHDISFTVDDPIDDLVDVPLDQIASVWDSALWESEILNPENVLGGGLAGPPELRIELDPLVTGRYVRVTRLPDRDLSGTDGQGNPDESDVLSLGEVEVYGELVCPDEGDTVCEGLDIFGPEGNNFGEYSVTATATDASGDFPIYTFMADNGAGDVQFRGPQLEDTTTFNLGVGTWTISVTIDDDEICTDPEGTCSETIEVIDVLCEESGICNLALQGVASQSSTGFGGPAERAIDGNTDGVYPNGSVTHTATGDLEPWWEVDLQQIVEVDRVLIWNRTDCCQGRLHNFLVIGLDEDRNEVYNELFFDDGSFPDTLFDGFEVEMDGAPARYVRIEHLGDITGAGLFLSLAEVEIFGETPTDCPAEGDPDFGDTRCTDLAVTGPGGTPGTYTATATATDGTGDPITYRFTADDGQGTTLNAGPQASNIATFDLTAGTWTISVTVDDDRRCPDAADDQACTTEVVVTNQTDGVAFVRGDTNGDGATNLSDGVNVLNVLFLGIGSIDCDSAADTNADGSINLSDGVNVLNVLFLGIGSIPAPNACGDEPLAGEGECDSFPPCAP